MATRLVKPVVGVTYDDMEAYIQLPPPALGEPAYTIEELRSFLHANGIINGIDEEILKSIIAKEMYGVRLTVARGRPVKEGKDGYFVYKFKQDISRAPKENDDGSVDYWGVTLIETVVQGQEIVHYYPAVQGTEGITVKGARIAPKICKELPPLKGKGFERSEDNCSYIAQIDGKVEMHRDRITILPVYEIYGNIDLVSGNINFSGDVIVHGNVCTGASITATESVTVDGIMEGAVIEAGKDVVVRNGIKGGYEGRIITKGNVVSKYMEYVTVEADGNVETDSMIDCTIKAGEKVILTGKHGQIIGGFVTALAGIDAVNIGNDTEVETHVGVGVEAELLSQIAALQAKISTTEQELDKINQALNAFEEYEKNHGVSMREDPRRMQLLRARIRDTSIIAGERAKLQRCNETMEKGATAIINVTAGLYPRVSVRIDEIRTKIRQKEVFCRLVRKNDKIVLERLGSGRQIS
ncbi:MAG: FapA family protein [Eubacterium sp.]|nr:FapA family protein [Eubacterium sp.]